MTMNAVLSSSTALANLFALAGQGQAPEGVVEGGSDPFAALIALKNPVSGGESAPKMKDSVAKMTGMVTKVTDTATDAPDTVDADPETALPPGIARLIGLPVTPRGKGKGAGGDPETAGPKIDAEVEAEVAAEGADVPVALESLPVETVRPEAAVPVAIAPMQPIADARQTPAATLPAEVTREAPSNKPEVPANTPSNRTDGPSNTSAPIPTAEIARLFAALSRQGEAAVGDAPDAQAGTMPPIALSTPTAGAAQPVAAAADPLAVAASSLPAKPEMPIMAERPAGDIAIDAPDAPALPASAPRVEVIVQAAAPAVPSATAATVQPVVNASETTIDHHLDVARDGEWLDRLARDIAGFATENGRLRFQLNPEHLGSLQVELAQASDGASVRFTADTEAARALIADAQPRLVAEAKAHGLKIAETHVDLGGQQQMTGQQQQQQRQQAAEAQPAWARAGQTRQGDPAPEDSGERQDRYA